MMEASEQEAVWSGSNGWSERDILIRSMYLSQCYRLQSRKDHQEYYQRVIETEPDPELKSDYEASKESQGEQEAADCEILEFLTWILTERGHLPRLESDHTRPELISERLGEIAIPRDEVKLVAGATTLMKLYLLRRLWITCDEIIEEAEGQTARTSFGQYPPDLISMCRHVIYWHAKRFKRHVPYPPIASGARPEDVFPDIVLYTAFSEIAKLELID